MRHCYRVTVTQILNAGADFLNVSICKIGRLTTWRWSDLLNGQFKEFPILALGVRRSNAFPKSTKLCRQTTSHSSWKLYSSNFDRMRHRRLGIP